MPGKENGVANGRDRSFANFDPDDPEYIRDLQRPAAIKEDLTEMERRKRVQQVLDSKSFCRELEELIKQETDTHKNDPDHLKTLQRLSELTLPQGQLAAASLHGISASAVVPIADIRSVEKYSKHERILRNKLAALYRLVDLFQWSQGIYNHITLRVSAESEEILINPFGLLYHEITAGSLVKVNLDGEVLDAGNTKMGINQAGYVLHSAIHRSRPDVRCIIHMHTAVVGAVSSMKCGLLPICQEAIIIGPVSYHDFQGIVDDVAERESIANDLGPTNKVMLLRNHGFVACGATVEEALHLAWNVVLACETQIRAARAGIENLVIPDEKARERAYRTAQMGGGGVLRSPNKDDPGKAVNWRVGELEWEAWMRVLDNAGFRTGHLYRQPFLRSKTAAPTAAQSDVAVPPSASSVGAVDETDAEAVAAHRVALLRREQERTRWLNSPNAYQKVEVLETGTDHPKVITKWVQDATSPSHGTPVKINSPHQFSPFGVNPKEFKDKQRAIKENRRLGTTSAGPQSQILEGVTYEEMAQMRDAEMSGLLPQDRVVMIGTASKGIIDREYQHNAQVYRQLYAPNPFASETDEDIQKYMKEIESKTPRPASSVHNSTTLDETRATASPPPYETESPSAEVQLLTRETTFDEQNRMTTRMVEKPSAARQQPVASSSGGLFGRSKSERFPTRKGEREADVRKAEGKAASDDELDGAKEGKKKKKRGFFSFGKKKK